MNNILIYTFRTNKNIDDFKKLGFKIFVFGKLKEDIERLKDIIQKENIDFIVGFAEIKTKTRFENVAINKFNKGVISKTGKEFYNLEVFNIKDITNKKHFNNLIYNDNLKLSEPKVTSSFCNWTMYKIAEFLENNRLSHRSILEKNNSIKHYFVHYNKKDLEGIVEIIKKEIE